MKLLIFLLSLCVTSQAATITNWGAQLPTAVPAGTDVILMQKSGVTYYFTPNQLAVNMATNLAWATVRVTNLLDSSNVKYWGAVGDGVTDDTAAIQATINAAPTGGVVYFPAPSAYYRAEPDANGIRVGKSLTFRGDGQNTKIKIGPEASTYRPLFILSNNVHLVVQDLNLEGPNANGDALYRAFGWNQQYITGSLTLRRITSTKFQEVVKMEASATVDSCVLTMDQCDIGNTNDGATHYVAIQVGTIGLTNGGVMKISRSTFRAGASSYCIYRAWQTSLSLQDCDIGPGDSRGSGWLIYAEGGAAIKPTFDLISNCRFNSTNVLNGSILTDKYALEQIENCSFTGGRGLECRGSARVINCRFDGVSVNDRNDSLAGSDIQFDNCYFLNTSIVAINSTALLTLSMANSTLEYTGGAQNYLIQCANTGATMRVVNCTLMGGTNTQIRIDSATKVDVKSCYFYNGTSSNSFNIFAPANVLDVRVTDCWFQDSTKAHTVSTGSYVRREIGNRSGMKTSTLASADLLVLDLNYDTFRITGTTTINKVSIQGTTWNDHPTTDFNGKVTLIVEGAFALGNSGNVLASAGARTVGTALQLVYDGDNGKWIALP